MRKSLTICAVVAALSLSVGCKDVRSTEQYRFIGTIIVDRKELEVSYTPRVLKCFSSFSCDALTVIDSSGEVRTTTYAIEVPNEDNGYRSIPLNRCTRIGMGLGAKLLGCSNYDDPSAFSTFPEAQKQVDLYMAKILEAKKAQAEKLLKQ